jgi:uncharacterized membrane protein YhaH (DUF805 family)
MSEMTAIKENTDKKPKSYRHLFWWQWLILFGFAIARFIIEIIAHDSHPLSSSLTGVMLEKAEAQRGGSLFGAALGQIFWPYIFAWIAARLAGKSAKVFQCVLWSMAILVLAAGVCSVGFGFHYELP